MSGLCPKLTFGPYVFIGLDWSQVIGNRKASCFREEVSTAGKVGSNYHVSEAHRFHHTKPKTFGTMKGHIAVTGPDQTEDFIVSTSSCLSP